MNDKNYITPKYKIEAPINVAEWPPLGLGGTPSIWGKAQNHFLSISIRTFKITEFYLIMPFFLPLHQTKPFLHQAFVRLSLGHYFNWSNFNLLGSHFIPKYERYMIPLL